jgi:hypothetical protein
MLYRTEAIAIVTQNPSIDRKVGCCVQQRDVHAKIILSESHRFLEDFSFWKTTTAATSDSSECGSPRKPDEALATN